MLEVRNYDGLLTFLLGMIFLVFAGITLSLFADRFSESIEINSQLQFEIKRQKEQIRGLRLKLELTSSHRKKSKISHADDLKKARLIELSQRAVASRLVHLSRLQARLAESLPEIERSFHSYRVKSREGAWARFKGELVGDLETSDGRVFREAVIVGVTGESISIRHSSGCSSIPARALADEYWERLQWERPRPLTYTVETTIPKLVSLKTEDHFISGNQTGSHAPKEVNLVALRAALQRAGEAVERLTNDLPTVSSIAEKSDSRSVPGSLDTWAERKTEISRKLANARMEYAKARANLKILSSNDRLLDVWRMPWGSSVR